MILDYTFKLEHFVMRLAPQALPDVQCHFILCKAHRPTAVIIADIAMSETSKLDC